MKQEINSYRLAEKENMIKFLKSEKNSYRAKQQQQQLQIQVQQQQQQAMEKKEKSSIKAHSKVIDLLKI